MASPETVTIVVPAFNEGEGIGPVVASLKAAAPWHEILVVDDGSSDGTGLAATRAGARVVRHPYNKGNGAAVKTAIRSATTEWITIVDADGQHQPDDARRIAERLGEFDLVIGARDPRTQATHGRRLGNAVLNWIASYLTERQIPDLTSG
ncbi:MAG TPA: glycosyltransferase family 2 protein, partial [Vicinamibacterales bacterium]|nr:glycosyltransferase family 2 protein [Vicinamibacterales bacterium]